MLCHVLAIVIVLVLTVLERMSPAIAHPMQHPLHLPARQSSSEFAAFVKDMNAGMKKMMTDMHRPGITGNVDVDFLDMMIPHHEGAIEMARLELLYGKDPLVRNLAEEMIASQQVEIMAMHDRLLVLQQGENLDPDHFPALTGVRGITVTPP
jgi:uncharacterized protein (DUF305 family)